MALQPGRYDTYAEKLFPAFSITIAYCKQHLVSQYQLVSRYFEVSPAIESNHGFKRVKI